MYRITPLLFLAIFFATPHALAVAPVDSSACTQSGLTYKNPVTLEILLVCNGQFWESCSLSPAPGQCPTHTPVTPSTLTTNLWPGDFNPVDQVKLLQTFLNTEMLSRLPVTGFFGPMTLAAVITLQNRYSAETFVKAHYNAPTGFVGQYTRDLINSKLR